ncbi:hypothetical protein GGI15_003467 [Coemansia interrupta]|uniref:Coatomer subunit epsilon n=1 Tax=Coemansia interrupta TaxID=1126814 RepID=A0A9W8HF06_9FUNG|nr:hypothetical protein GGI15_003467 [Coemansia interrupta]
MTDHIDDFYTARNLLYLGAYPQALTSLSHVHATSSQEPEQQSLKHRALLLQGTTTMLSSLPTALPLYQAVHLLPQRNTPEAIEAITPLLTTANLASATFAAVAAQVLGELGRDEALRILAMHPRSLECVALSVALLLGMDRADMAQKLVAKSRGWAEDAPLAQMAEAWVALHVGGAKYTEGLYIFDEMAQAVAAETPLLLNARAVCRMHLGQVPEAEELLLQALGMQPGHADTLANLVVCANLSAKTLETKERYLGQLRDAAPQHPFVSDLDAKSAEFDQLALRFTQ